MLLEERAQRISDDMLEYVTGTCLNSFGTTIPCSLVITRAYRDMLCELLEDLALKIRRLKSPNPPRVGFLGDGEILNPSSAIPGGYEVMAEKMPVKQQRGTIPDTYSFKTLEEANAALAIFGGATITEKVVNKGGDKNANELQEEDEG